MALSESPIASATVGPLTRARTGPSCSSLLRSHSQAPFADRSAQVREKTARQFGSGVWQLGGPRSAR